MTLTEIINNALIALGEPPINNLGEDSKAASVIRAVLPTCLTELYDSQAYDFGYRTESLLLTEPQFKNLSYRFSYFMPRSCSYLKAVEPQHLIKHMRYLRREEQSDFRQINDRNGRIIILSNVESAVALYYESTDDTSVFPVDFANALTYLLASKIAQTITSDIMAGDKMAMHFNAYHGQAMAKSLQRQHEYRHNQRIPKMLRNRFAMFDGFNNRGGL